MQFLSQWTVSFVHLLPTLALVPPAHEIRMLKNHHVPTTNNTHSSSYCEKDVYYITTIYKLGEECGNITSILNEKCHPPPPLDDPGLAVLGTERVWPGLRL